MNDARDRLQTMKIVDVFVRDRIIASYPVIAEGSAGPTPDDQHFIELAKAQMKGAGSYSDEDLAVAKYMVRGLLD